MKVMGVRTQGQSKKDMIAKMLELMETDETKCAKMFKELKTHTGTYCLSFKSNLPVEFSLVNIFCLLYNIQIYLLVHLCRWMGGYYMSTLFSMDHQSDCT